MMTPEIATITCQAFALAMSLRIAGAVPQMTPAWAMPSSSMANVGGVMLVVPAPGTPTIATGYQPGVVRATRPANAPTETSHPVPGVIPPSSSRCAHQYPIWWTAAQTKKKLIHATPGTSNPNRATSMATTAAARIPIVAGPRRRHHAWVKGATAVSVM